MAILEVKATTGLAVPPEVIKFARELSDRMGIRVRSLTFVPGTIAFPVDGFTLAHGMTDVSTGDVVVGYTDPEQAKRTILHEFCHLLAGEAEHGPRWEQCWERYKSIAMEPSSRQWGSILFYAALTIVAAGMLYGSVRTLARLLQE